MSKPRKASRFHEYNRTSAGRFRNGKARAKRKGLPWTLDLATYESLIAKPCYYCDGPLDPVGVGLDRCDSSKGYTLDNVVACCGVCNNLKHVDISKRDFKILSKLMKFMKENI